jgi:hypothetical protein
VKSCNRGYALHDGTWLRRPQRLTDAERLAQFGVNKAFELGELLITRGEGKAARRLVGWGDTDRASLPEAGPAQERGEAAACAETSPAKASAPGPKRGMRAV